MFDYGIKLVWAGWGSHENVIGFSYKGYRDWKSTVGIGTRMLIYETEGTGDRFSSSTGTKAIIGEVKVTGAFYKDELGAPSPQHPWLALVEVIRSVPAIEPVTLSEIREILGDKGFPELHETWRRLDERQYRELTKKWS